MQSSSEYQISPNRIVRPDISDVGDYSAPYIGNAQMEDFAISTILDWRVFDFRICNLPLGKLQVGSVAWEIFNLRNVYFASWINFQPGMTEILTRHVLHQCGN